jgi:Fic family protein
MDREMDMISEGTSILPSISPEMLRLVAELDEFRAQWKAFKAMTPERLTALRFSATIESIGSSTRIEGVSRNTIKATLQSLVKRGWLTLRGQGRGAYYTKN